MSAAKKISGLALATAAASLFAMAPITSHAGEGDVKCYGVNACKGKTACQTASNACKGLNACKGTGWVSVSKEACDAIGGKTES